MANVSFIKKELKTIQKSYQLISDCLKGEFEVKKQKDKYLPRPNAEDETQENLERYNAYLMRAVFYNVTSRTLQGLVGRIFYKNPVIELPVILKDIESDANGGGVSLVQSAKRALIYVLAHGRAGLFVDYPKTEGLISKKQLETNGLMPTIKLYEPWRVINWRTKSKGAKTILSLVVLIETYISFDDGFEEKEKIQCRVLRLGSSEENEDSSIINNDIYTVEIWHNESGKFNIVEEYQPTDFNGNFLNEIPFTFLGSENNDVEIDQPPLFDLASINIAHYRNSADYEESCFIIGQPTPWFSGLTEAWVKEIMKGEVALGARGAVLLPENGGAGLLQAEPNTMAFEAMQHKERQMISLGAKLVEQKNVQRTATEANIEEIAESSILMSSAKNVSEGYEWALNICSLFVSNSNETSIFQLNSDFDLSSLTSQDRAQLISEWQSSAITFEEMRDNLKKGGIATLDHKIAKKQIDDELTEVLKLD